MHGTDLISDILNFMLPSKYKKFYILKIFHHKRDYFFNYIEFSSNTFMFSYIHNKYRYQQ